MEGKETTNQGEPSTAQGQPLATTTSLPTPNSAQWQAAGERMASIVDEASTHFGLEGIDGETDAQPQQQEDPTNEGGEHDQETGADVKDEDETGHWDNDAITALLPPPHHRPPRPIRKKA